MITSAIKRFLKGFIAGGVAAVVALLKAGISVSSLAEIKSVATVLIVAFLTGGFLAIEKMLNWTPEPTA